LSAPALATLHYRAGAWFAGEGMVVEAVHHYLAAGNASAAASTVERHARAALAREDWPSLAAWLDLLPAELVATRPDVLLAKAYVAHLSGRFAAVRDILAEIRTLLKRDTRVSTVHRGLLAECDALELSQTLVLDQNPHAVSVTRNAVERIPANYRFARGIAYIACGMALQSVGRTDEAIGWLSMVADREAERVDAGSIRTLMGLMFVHRQAGHYFECRQVSGHMLELAERHDLPVSAGWARWALGWIAYEHNELETAIAHFEAIAVDWQRLHFACFCEGMFGLAIAYQARGMPLEARVTMRQLTEAVRDQHAFPYLPSISLFEARLALIRGDMQASLASIDASDGSLAGNSMVTFEHEVISRAKVLIAHGTEQSLAVARGDVERLLAAAASGHHRARLVEILALSALVHEALGQREIALAHLRQSLDLGAPAGFCRTYVDLGPAIVPLLELIVTDQKYADSARRQLAVIKTGEPVNQPGTESVATSVSNAPELLTFREADVLDGLCRRLSYQEIAEELFISVHTVKSHTHHIYEKLGVVNRRQALRKAQELGMGPERAPAKPGS
jgi:LuxR family maltose regulon positive regulatory protein